MLRLGNAWSGYRSRRSCTRYTTLEPRWGSVRSLEVEWREMRAGSLQVQVFDEDTVGKDDLLGEATLDLALAKRMPRRWSQDDTQEAEAQPELPESEQVDEAAAAAAQGEVLVLQLNTATAGFEQARSASRSLRRALLTQQVTPGSSYRCGKRN